MASCVSIIFTLQIRNLRLVPGNLRQYASYVSPRVATTAQEIRAGPVQAGEKLIEVPIGTIDFSSTVSITIGLDNVHFNTEGVEANPRIGITDGTTAYSVWILDVSGYPNVAPCYSINGQNSRKGVTPGTKVPSTFKITFHPGQLYGYCETAQDGGYINTFNERRRMDLTKPLYLQLFAHTVNEVYPIYYIGVDIF